MITKIHYTPGANVPVLADENIEGARLVKIAKASAGRNPVVAKTAKGDTAFGVTAHDVKAGEVVTAYRVGHILEVACTGAVKAGEAVAADADGKAVKTAEGATPVAVAVSDAADGFVAVALF